MQVNSQVTQVSSAVRAVLAVASRPGGELFGMDGPHARAMSKNRANFRPLAVR